MRRTRARRAMLAAITRWGCSAACVLALLAFVLSGWFAAGRMPGTRPRQGVNYTEFGLTHGRLGVVRVVDPQAPTTRVATRWYWLRHNSDLLPQWKLWFSQTRTAQPPATLWMGTLPLWAPAALFAIPAGLLWLGWWKCRRVLRAGQCVCGYARAGLAAFSYK